MSIYKKIDKFGKKQWICIYTIIKTIFMKYSIVKWKKKDITITLSIFL